MIKLKSLLIESGVLVKNKKTGNVYRVKKSNPEKHDDVGKEERDDIAKQRKHDYSNAPHESEPGFGDSESEYDVNAWNEHYVKRDENGSATIGTPHSENDEKAQEFVEKNVIPAVKDIMKKAKDEGKEVVFMPEGGQGGDHQYYPGTEQERVAQEVKSGGGAIDTWDGEYSNHWEDDAPIYDDMDEKTEGKYSKSQLKGATYAMLVGQGDDPKESMDYLDQEGEQFLRDSGYDGEIPPQSDEDKEKLYHLAFPNDSGGKVEEGPISEVQESYNASRRDNLCKKKKEYENGDPPKVVIVTPGATHAYDLEC
jgi:hypothetical protein